MTLLRKKKEGRQNFKKWLLAALSTRLQNISAFRWKKILFFLLTKPRESPISRIFCGKTSSVLPILYYRLVFLSLFHKTYIFYTKTYVFWKLPREMMLLYLTSSRGGNITQSALMRSKKTLRRSCCEFCDEVRSKAVEVYVPQSVVLSQMRARARDSWSALCPTHAVSLPSHGGFNTCTRITSSRTADTYVYICVWGNVVIIWRYDDGLVRYHWRV